MKDRILLGLISCLKRDECINKIRGNCGVFLFKFVFLTVNLFEANHVQSLALIA